ncbi:Protein F20D12.2 [Aphelenchoides avenae]|nr:Protein F20D12.2 [Aphelenchus avenae]
MDILRKRDELMCKLRVRNTDVDSARVVNGCCPDMCPEKERYVRVVQKRLNAYECNEQGQMAPEKTEEPLPHELRPAPVLQRTMTYLIGAITNEGPSKENLVQWYDFLWSRTRSIRKDITQQMLSDRSAADLVEKCTRFHIFAAFRFAEYPATDFDQKMNTENLSKCLQTLRHMYEDLEKEGLYCENEAEFRAYDVMLNLTDSNVLSQVLAYRKDVRESQPVQLSLRLASAVQNNNYIRFFRLLRTQATFLQYPLTEFANILGFNDEQEAMNFAAAFGLSLVMAEANRYGTAHEIPDPSLTTWVLDKMGGQPLAEVLYNGRMPPIELLEPVDSFTEDGVYYRDPVLQSYMDPGELDSDAAFVRPHAVPKPLQEDRREVQVAAFVNQASESIIRSAANDIMRHVATESLQENRARVERQRAQVERRTFKDNCMGFVRQTVEGAIQRACSAELARIAEEQLSTSTRKRLQTQTRALTEKKSTTLLNSIVKRELRQIATEVHQARVVDVKERLARIRNNLHKSWLKKFVDRWMDVVWSRKRYEAHIREVLESFPDKPPTNPTPMTDRPLRWYPLTVEHPAAEIEFILRHRKLQQRREKRIAFEYFHRWREAARYRAETRRQMQVLRNVASVQQPFSV